MNGIGYNNGISETYGVVETYCGASDIKSIYICELLLEERT